MATIPVETALPEVEQDSAETQIPLLNHNQVRGFLKQRFPLVMLDTVISIEPRVRVVAVKNVSGNEIQFLGHFPENPLMPGVLIIESLAQTAAFLGWSQATGTGAAPTQYLGSVDVSFYKPVCPGDQLVNEVRQARQVANMQIVSVISRVRQKIVARGELVLATERQS